MKHITSKLLSLLLCLAMLMSMAPVAYANDTESTGVDNVDNNVSIPEDSVNDETKMQTATGNIVTVNGTSYATLEEAFAAAEQDESGVITYTINGKAEVTATGWVQVAKAGLTGLTKVKFVGASDDAEICIVENAGLLADQNYDIDVSFANLILSKKAPGWVGDMGHAANYFTCWLRNTDAANNTVTYTNCTFPNGACNNQYGKTVYDNCQFTNSTTRLYNLWNYGGNTEIKNSTFTGTRGIKTYNEGTLAAAPTVKVENTKFDSLTEKAAIVVSKATDVTLENVGATGCGKGLLQKDIEGSTEAEKVTITANGTGIGGIFNVNGDKGAEKIKEEFNITAGTFTGAVSEGYLADGFTLVSNADGTCGVQKSTSTAVAKTANGTEYTTLEAALTAVTKDNPLTYVDESVWSASKPVYYNGGFYETIGEVLYDAQQQKGAIQPGVESAVIYCRPGATISKGSASHPSFVTSTTIYGNGATLIGATEWDVENYFTLNKDITINIYSLNGGASVWSTRNSDFTVTVNMENCIDAHEVLFNYGSGNGRVIANVKNCTFLKSGGAAHGWPVSINCLGSLTVDGCTFDGVITGVVVNVKQPSENGEMKVSVTNSTFNNVTGQDNNKGALRVTGQKECKIGLTIDKVQFTGTHAAPEDITLGNAKSEENLGEISYTISNTTGSLTTHKVGDTTPTSSALDGTTVTGTNTATAVGKGTEANPYTLAELGAMTRAEYSDAQTRLNGTMYVTVGNYSYDKNGVLGNGERNDTPGQTPDHSKLNAYGENGYLGEKNDGANGKSIVFVGGTITSGATGYASIDNIGTSLLLAVPAYTNVTFKDTTFNNVMSFNYQLYTSPWSQLGELKFDGCTFNGIIVGAIAAQTLTFNGCTFTNYTNTDTDSANNSNPIWVRPAYGNWTKGDNEGQGGDFRSLTTINFTGNTVISTRPVKFERIAQWEMPTTVTATGNSFDIKAQTGDDSTKNVGLYFGANAKFDLVAEGNKKAEGSSTAALYTAVYSAPNGVSYAGLPAGSTVKDSQGNEAKLDALKWKATDTDRDKLTLTTTKEVASMTNTKGTVNFATLQEAIDAATRNATVKLLADTKENVTISKAMTLDLNGHTLNGGTEKGKPALTITARTVTIKDSSEAQTGTIMREDTAENSGVSSHYVIDIQGNAWVMFESGNVKNDSGNDNGKGASLVRVGDDSVAKYPGLNIKGGTFTQDNFIVIKVDSGDLFLNGGTLNCANSYAVENWHRATIKGGTVNGNVSSWTYSGGLNSTLTISGGTVNGDVESVSYDGSAGKKASVSITGGTVNGTLMTGIYGSATEPTKDMATIEVTGGTFSSDPTKYVVEGSTATQNGDGTYGVAKAYLAKVGDTSYYTMDEAFKAQTASGAEIVLLRDYTTGSTFNSGTVARVVDLNGHTWTCTGTDANSAAFEINNPNASLTVKNGKIVSSQLVGLIPSAMGGTIKYDNSSLTFENVEMSTTATSGIETNGNNTNDSVTLKNSTLNVPNGFGIYFPSSGTLTIDNSTINAKTMGVQVCAGSLSINAGSAITVTGGPVDKAEGDGAIQDGAAISIVNRTGYKGLGNITVTGGTFKANGTNAAIKAYDWNNANKKEDPFTESDKVAVSGGTFSSAVPEGLCAEGYEPIENPDGTTYGVQEIMYAQIGETKYKTLADAIAAAKDGATVTLLADATEDVTINKNITLDLGGKTLTNTSTGKATISVTGGTVTVKNGNVIGGTGYYNIEVTKNSNADLTLENVTATAGNNGSSMIDNWGTLTIESGTYTGGLDVVKSEEGSTLNIHGGKFTLNYSTDGYTGVILNYGTATITDGEFIQNATSGGRWDHPQVVATGVVEGYPAITKITGGTFTNNMSGEGIFRGIGKGTSDNFEVSGGTFNKSISDGYCADGFIPTKNADGTYGVKEGKYVAAVGSKNYETLADAIKLAAKGKTVTLLADLSNIGSVSIPKNLTIDGNGHTISGNSSISVQMPGDASADVTIRNVTFKDIANGNKLSAFYFAQAKGKLTITDCTFDSIEYEALQITPAPGAVINISNNKFIAKSDGTQVRHIHVEMAYGSGFDYEGETIQLTITDNQLFGKVSGDASMGVWWVGTDSNLKLDGNFIEDPNTVSVTLSKAGVHTNAGDLIYPARSQAEVDVDDLMPVAVVLEAASGESKTHAYNTLAEAIAAAENGQTVKLLSDVTITGKQLVIEAGKQFTLDLNGKTLKISRYTANAAQVDVFGDLTLADSSKAQNGTICSDYTGTAGLVVCVEADGKLTMNGGMITTEGMAKAGNALKLARNAVVTMNGGTVKCDAKRGNRAVNIMGSAAQFTMTGGSVIAEAGDGTETAIIAICGAGNSTITISEDSIVSGPQAVTASRSNIAIAGGNFTGTIDVKNGSISGGTFDRALDEKACAAGFIPTENEDGTYGVKQGAYVAQVGTEKYESLEAAIAAAGDGDTIDLLSNITVSGTTISTEKNVIIDLKGYTITSTGITFDVYGTLTVKDSSAEQTGVIDSGGRGVYLNSGSSKFTLQSGTLKVGDQPIKMESGSTLCVTGGMIQGLSVDPAGYVIDAWSNATVEISGGTVTGKTGDIIYAEDGSKVIVTGGKLESTINASTSLYTIIRAKNSDVTVSGGEFTADGAYGIDILGNSTLTITGGSFNCNMTAIQVESGAAYIKGGEFKLVTDTKNYMLNCIDAAYKAGTAKMEVSGGTFYGFDPSANPEGTGTSYVKVGYVVKDNGNSVYTVEESNAEAAMFDADGNLLGYADVAAALANSDAKTVKLIKDVTDSAVNVILHSGVILDLNGHALTAEFVYAPLGGDAGIIDSAVKGGGTGKLLLKDMKTSMGYTDGYMPIYAGQEDGLHCYKFYTVKYYPVNNVNKGTDEVEIRFWFIFESKQAYKDILDHPDQFRVQLDTDLGVAGGGARQTLYFEFRQDMITSWAQQNYNGFDSHNGAKFLVVLRGLDEAGATTITGTPFAESKYTMAKYYGNDITIK